MPQKYNNYVKMYGFGLQKKHNIVSIRTLPSLKGLFPIYGR